MALTTSAYVGRNLRWGLDQFELSGQGNDLSHSRDSQEVDGTGFGSRFEYGLSGLQKSNIEVKGQWAEDQKFGQIINQRFGQDADALAWYAPKGIAALNPLVMQPSAITSYKFDAKHTGGETFDIKLAARGYCDDGFIFVSPGAFLTTSGIGTVRDNTPLGGATAAGGNAQIHILSTPTGTTPSLTMKLQHSPDNITFTDLCTFNVITTQTAQRIVLPSQTTIQAYVRANWTISGTTPSFECLVGFARGIVYS